MTVRVRRICQYCICTRIWQLASCIDSFSAEPSSTELSKKTTGRSTGGQNATNLHGKITKCATAGSFDDTEAVKQTRYFEK